MNDSEIRNLLLTTCPVLPGQENRAWLRLKERIAAPAKSSKSWLSWRSVGYAAGALAVVPMIFELGIMMRPDHHSLVFADSQVPGIYATSFYSHSAQAQVVWLNGMDPATDRPTYLDPTTVIKPTPNKNSNRL